MSILIKGRRKPLNCLCCKMMEMNYMEMKPWCYLTGEDIPCECPIVELPPHGRLIDASEKIKVQIYDDMTEDYRIMVDITVDDLLSQGWIEANAPTIIEAEEENK